LIDLLTRVGGTERQLSALVKNLDPDKFETQIIVLQSDPGLNIREFREFGCPVHYLGISRLASIYIIVFLIRLVLKIRHEKIDIVQTFFVDANILGVIAAKLGRVRSIIVSRRDLGYWYTTRLLFIFKWLNKLADRYLVNSEAVKNVVIENEGVHPHKIRVIYNGIFELPKIHPGRFDRNSLNIPDDSKIVGIVANLRQVKRLDLFLETAARIKYTDVYYVIIGKGELLEQLYNQARELGISDKIRIIHLVDKIYDYINQFTVGVLTSETEGLSNALIEYQLCGIPAVAFNVGGNREIIEDERTGFLVEPFDIDKMSKIIQLLLKDDGHTHSIGNNAKLSARERFSGSVMVSKTAAFYEEILNNHNSPSEP